jgi:hypothetical protein
MSNANWVCFDCRETMHRPTEYPGPVACRQCGAPGRCLGTQIRVPARVDERAWRELRARLRDARSARAEAAVYSRVRRRHQLERQIAELEARPANEARTVAIRRAKDPLAAL